MKKLEYTEKTKAFTEEEAKEYIESMRAAAQSGDFILKKAGYEYKTKKAKGEIVDEAWIVTIVKTFNGIWEDAE